MKLQILLMTAALFCTSTAGMAQPVSQHKTTVTISFAGDCTLGSDLRYGKSASFIETFEKQPDPYQYFFANFKDIFTNGDLAVVNLEGPLTNKGVKANKEFAFRGPKEYTGILTAGGIDIVNLANNHTYDYGEAGYVDTIKNLDEAGIASYGVDKPYIAQVKDAKIGFLGYKAWSADKNTMNKIAKDISDIRQNGANAVVVSFHGGDEGKYYPNNIQKALFRHAADSGADLVIGHHPHVVQGIELYKDKYLVYSLGNFCFGGNRNPTDKDTFIFRQTFEFDAEMRLSGASANLVPCLISSISNRNNFQPTPQEGDAAKKIMDKINNLSKPLNNNKNITEYLNGAKTD